MKLSFEVEWREYDKGESTMVAKRRKENNGRKPQELEFQRFVLLSGQKHLHPSQRRGGPFLDGGVEADVVAIPPIRRDTNQINPEKCSHINAYLMLLRNQQAWSGMIRQRTDRDGPSQTATGCLVTEGSFWEFTADPLACMRKLHAAHGEFAVMRDGAQQVVFVFGPRLNHAVLSDTHSYHARFFGIAKPRDWHRRPGA